MRIIALFIFALFASVSHSQTSHDYQLETIAKNLDHPWSLAFLPDGSYLVSMRSGELRRIGSNAKIGKPISNTPKTYVRSQGGYFDIVLDPEFDSNQTVYLAFAYGTPKANATRVVRATLTETSLENVTPIFTVEPLKNTPVHYGGRLQFLNDGTLLISTGDGFNFREASQDPFNQMGKIIRINKDGSVPDDNPFANGKQGDPKVYSIGHRNPQGLSYDPLSNTIYMHEHGPKGGDEINIVTPGNNYGWPVTSYGVNYSGARVSPFTKRPGITDAVKFWTPSVAPSGLAYYTGEAFPKWQGSLFIGTLVNQDVRRISLNQQETQSEEILFREIGERIRDVRVDATGHIYILTDGNKGKLIRISPRSTQTTKQAS